MAKSVKLKDGSYIDASGVWDTTQAANLNSILSNMWNVKDCSSEIVSTHSSVYEKYLWGMGKLRILIAYSKPAGTIAQRTWIENFVRMSTYSPSLFCVNFTPANWDNVTSCGYALMNPDPCVVRVNIGTQSYPSGSNNTFILTAIYFVN